MDERLGELLDIIMLIIILGVAFSSGYASVMKTNKEMRDYRSPYEDKNTAPKYDGFSVYNERNAVLTKGEVLLMCAVQDDGIAGPQTFTYGGTITDTQIAVAGEANGVTYPNFTTTGKAYLTYTPTLTAVDAEGNPYTYKGSTTTVLVTSGSYYNVEPGDKLTVYGVLLSGATVAGDPTTVVNITEAGIISASKRDGYIDVGLRLQKKEEKEAVLQNAWNVLRYDSDGSGYTPEYRYDITKVTTDVGVGDRFNIKIKGTAMPDGTVR